MRKRFSLFVMLAPIALISIAVAIVAFSSSAFANGQDTCPSGGDWVKVDNLSGNSYLYTAPAGKLIAEVCYKHSTFVHQFLLIPPVSSYLLVVDLHDGKLHDLSHASFRLIDDEQLCDETVAQDPIIEWGEWSEWVFNPNTGLMERERFGTSTTIYVDARDGETECNREVEELYEQQMREPETETVYFGKVSCEGYTFYAIDIFEGEEGEPYVVSSDSWEDPFTLESVTEFGITLHEPEECLETHEFEVFFNNDCGGWAVGYILDHVATTVHSGVWTDPNDLETAAYDGFVVPGEDEFFVEAGIVSEPQECFVCEVEPLYRMITLIDYDAPDWYWGVGAYNGTCYIILHDADAPAAASIERQVEICSVCSQPDFYYEADRVLYDGWVVKDCNGNITYVDPRWEDVWFRDDFDAICQEESCLNPRDES